MPDFAALSGGPAEAGANAATSLGIAVADAATDTKGSWIELIASTLYPTAWVLPTLTGTANQDSFLVDIGIGASTAEKVLIPDLGHDSVTFLAPSGRNWIVPLSIPAASRLSARCASSSSSGDTLEVGIVVIAGQMGSTPPMGQCEAFGVVTTGSTGTSVDPGATAHTEGAWVQLIAATAIPYRWMCLTFNINAALTAATGWLFDVGIGAAAAEKVLVPNIPMSGGTSNDSILPGSASFPVNIPAGTRIAARCQCNVNTASERLMRVHGFGVG